VKGVRAGGKGGGEGRGRGAEKGWGSGRKGRTGRRMRGRVRLAMREAQKDSMHHMKTVRPIKVLKIHRPQKGRKIRFFKPPKIPSTVLVTKNQPEKTASTRYKNPLKNATTAEDFPEHRLLLAKKSKEGTPWGVYSQIRSHLTKRRTVTTQREKRRMGGTWRRGSASEGSEKNTRQTELAVLSQSTRVRA